MSEFTVKQATRVGIKPLICAYSESGCGKTMSALLMARGLVGPNGKIVVADSESGRASLYADVIPGGFETFDLAAPFSPARYCSALDCIWKSGAAVGVIDSGSHEWEGSGGVLDMAGENEARSGKAGLHNWRLPKLEHAKFIQALLRSPIPLIVCLRAKYKTRQAKDEKGKTVILRDDMTSPIQAEDFIFEATCHFEILQSHSIILTKCSHPELRKCFPADKTTPITIEHGKALAVWCSAMAPHGPSNKPEQPATGDAGVKDAKGRLWKLLAPVRGAENNWALATEWLRKNKILEAGETVAGLTLDQLGQAFDKASIVLEGN